MSADWSCYSPIVHLFMRFGFWKVWAAKIVYPLGTWHHHLGLASLVRWAIVYLRVSNVREASDFPLTEKNINSSFVSDIARQPTLEFWYLDPSISAQGIIWVPNSGMLIIEFPSCIMISAHGAGHIKFRSVWTNVGLQDKFWGRIKTPPYNFRNLNVKIQELRN